MCVRRLSAQLNALVHASCAAHSILGSLAITSSLTMAEAAAAAAGAVTLDGLTVAGPTGVHGDAGAADAVMKRLEKDWGWGPAVTKYLREELGCETLHDLLANFRTDEDWREFYAADIKDGTGKKVNRTMRGRVSQCHDSLKKTQREAAEIKAKGEEAIEFEKPLGSEVLSNLLAAFWERHKLLTPLKKMPGDLLISRIFKELEKRFMHVTDLMKIKGVIWERKAETTKEQVGEHLYVERTPEQQDEVRDETVRNYLEVMEMYMLALAIVGAQKISPPPSKPETQESDPSDYVIFPVGHQDSDSAHADDREDLQGGLRRL